MTMKTLALALILTLSFRLFTSNDTLTLGTYTCIIKKQQHILVLKLDSTFVYHKGQYSYSFGKWSTKIDTLILHQPTLSSQDSLSIALMSGSYFKIDRMVFIIRDKMLVDAKHKKKYLLKE
jgi:hypothetical protein